MTAGGIVWLSVPCPPDVPVRPGAGPGDPRVHPPHPPRGLRGAGSPPRTRPLPVSCAVRRDAGEGPLSSDPRSPPASVSAQVREYQPFLVAEADSGRGAGPASGRGFNELAGCAPPPAPDDALSPRPPCARPPLHAAETACRRRSRYIFGGNEAGERMEMTTPVITRQEISHFPLSSFSSRAAPSTTPQRNAPLTPPDPPHPPAPPPPQGAPRGRRRDAVPPGAEVRRGPRHPPGGVGAARRAHRRRARVRRLRLCVVLSPRHRLSRSAPCPRRLSWAWLHVA